MIHIGCSGWNYRHWRGAFYPKDLPVKRWFAHYADRFPTVEVNASFYRLPSAETFARWREQAPPGFCYAVKAPRFIAHMHKLKEPPTAFLENVGGLGERLGPILYQLPPHCSCDVERLEHFLKGLPNADRSVFEFRDESWVAGPVLALLDRHHAAFCVHDMPSSVTPRWTCGRFAYVRFHGGAKKYAGDYSDAQLRDWADWMIVQAEGGRAVWAYFNNDLEARAIDCARRLQAMIDSLT